MVQEPLEEMTALRQPVLRIPGARRMNEIIKWHCGCGKLLTAPASAAGTQGPLSAVQGSDGGSNVAPGLQAAPMGTVAKPPSLPSASHPAAVERSTPAVERPPLPRGTSSDAAERHSFAAPSVPERPAASFARPIPPSRPIQLRRQQQSPRDFLHFVLLLALIPLAIDTLWSKPALEDFEERLATTAEAHPEIAPPLSDWANRLEAERRSSTNYSEFCPIIKSTARCCRDSHLHRLLAIVAAALFFRVVAGAVSIRQSQSAARSAASGC